MSLEEFRKSIRHYYTPAGFSQKMLAKDLGLHPTALSNKLNGTGNTSLKHHEARQIIKILAEWQAISTQGEALELLEQLNLKHSSFSPAEWQSEPLNKLTLDPAAAYSPAKRPEGHSWSSAGAVGGGKSANRFTFCQSRPLPAP